MLYHQKNIKTSHNENSPYQTKSYTNLNKKNNPLSYDNNNNTSSNSNNNNANAHSRSQKNTSGQIPMQSSNTTKNLNQHQIKQQQQHDQSIQHQQSQQQQQVIRQSFNPSDTPLQQIQAENQYHKETSKRTITPKSDRLTNGSGVNGSNGVNGNGLQSKPANINANVLTKADEALKKSFQIQGGGGRSITPNRPNYVPGTYTIASGTGNSSGSISYAQNYDKVSPKSKGLASMTSPSNKGLSNLNCGTKAPSYNMPNYNHHPIPGTGIGATSVGTGLGGVSLGTGIGGGTGNIPQSNYILNQQEESNRYDEKSNGSLSGGVLNKADETLQKSSKLRAVINSSPFKAPENLDNLGKYSASKTPKNASVTSTSPFNYNEKYDNLTQYNPSVPRSPLNTNSKYQHLTSSYNFDNKESSYLTVLNEISTKIDESIKKHQQQLMSSSKINNPFNGIDPFADKCKTPTKNHNLELYSQTPTSSSPYYTKINTNNNSSSINEGGAIRQNFFHFPNCNMNRSPVNGVGTSGTIDTHGNISPIKAIQDTKDLLQKADSILRSSSQNRIENSKSLNGVLKSNTASPINQSEKKINKEINEFNVQDKQTGNYMKGYGMTMAGVGITINNNTGQDNLYANTNMATNTNAQNGINAMGIANTCTVSPVTNGNISNLNESAYLSNKISTPRQFEITKNIKTNNSTNLIDDNNNCDDRIKKRPEEKTEEMIRGEELRRARYSEAKKLSNSPSFSHKKEEFKDNQIIPKDDQMVTVAKIEYQKFSNLKDFKGLNDLGYHHQHCQSNPKADESFQGLDFYNSRNNCDNSISYRNDYNHYNNNHYQSVSPGRGDDQTLDFSQNESFQEKKKVSFFDEQQHQQQHQQVIANPRDSFYYESMNYENNAKKPVSVSYQIPNSNISKSQSTSKQILPKENPPVYNNTDDNVNNDCFNNDCKSIQDVYYYPDGTYYDGEWENNKRSGYGTYYTKDGQIIYDGEWMDDKYHGNGLLCNLNIEEYKPGKEVDYKDLTKVGNKWIKYEGDFFSGKKHGIGSFYFIGGHKFSGKFRNDLAHGEGMYYFEDNMMVAGEWENHKFVNQK